ncbi:MAG: RadC family protein [Planctomycetota bacterium]
MAARNVKPPGAQGHRERLRRRFSQGALSGFLPYEILELALTYALPRKDVKDLAKRLLARFGGVHEVFSARFEDLVRLEGIGTNTAIYLRFLGALIAFSLQEKARARAVLDQPGAVVDYLRLSVGASREENFQVLFLNARNELLAMEVLQVGTVDQAVVYPRKVIERALARNAVGCILVHNHPSGHADPSPEDMALTTKIARAAEAVDLRIHDHLIITREGYFSFRERGLLKRAPARRSRAPGKQT